MDDGRVPTVEQGERYLAEGQLCDCLATAKGFCLMEQRFVEVALRHGTNALTLEKWRAFLGLRREFDEAVGGSVYRLLPGVVENTFGL